MSRVLQHLYSGQGEAEAHRTELNHLFRILLRWIFVSRWTFQGPGKRKKKKKSETKAGSMGLNYVRQDQTAPGADRLSAGPRGWRSRVGQEGAQPAELEITFGAEHDSPGRASPPLRPTQGGSRFLVLKLIFKFSRLTKTRTVRSCFAGWWNGGTTSPWEITTSLVENTQRSFLRWSLASSENWNDWCCVIMRIPEILQD